MGQSSDVSGYTSGGRAGISVNPIDKFQFASDANATDVGDTLVAVKEGAGSSSTSHGYIAGGEDTSARINTIQKFPFAADANATDVGDLTAVRNKTRGNRVWHLVMHPAGFLPLIQLKNFLLHQMLMQPM